MKQSNFSSSRRDSCCWLIKATALGLLYLAVSSVASAQEKSYSFLPLGYQNTACSRWVRVTDPKTQSVAFDGLTSTAIPYTTAINESPCPHPPLR